MADEEIAYAEESNAAWNAAAAAAATVRVEPDEADPVLIVVTVMCPRCGHHTAHVDRIRGYRALGGGEDVDPWRDSLLRDALSRVAGKNRSRDVLMRCDCRIAHPGALEGLSGCGALLSLHVEWGV